MSAPAEPPRRDARAWFGVPLTVADADLDEQAHVNNVVYVRWVMEAATAHWVALATAEERAEVGWVCTRHEIDYLAPAVLGDVLEVRTRVGHARGLLFERHGEVRRPSDDRLLARSRTMWCPVDPRTGRPRRVRDAMRRRFSLADDDGDARA